MAHAQKPDFVFPPKRTSPFNPLNTELNPICHLLALLGDATIVVVSRLRVKSVGASVQSTTGSRGVRISSSNGSNAEQTTFRGKVELYWLPTPFACFPFTSPPVRHRVPPVSERALPPDCLLGPHACYVVDVASMWL